MPVTTLSYGYLKPSNPTTGDEFFPAMETNIQLMNDHTHDGVNSAPLASTSQIINASGWIASAIGGGLFEQTVTMPSGFDYDVCEVWFKLSSGEIVYPSVERVSSTSYKIYTNDSSLEYIARYR